MKKIIKREVIKTTTMSATMSVSEMKETGMNYVQVLPDEPCAGLVEPFRGLGWGQLLAGRDAAEAAPLHGIQVQGPDPPRDLHRQGP